MGAAAGRGQRARVFLLPPDGRLAVGEVVLGREGEVFATSAHDSAGANAVAAAKP